MKTLVLIITAALVIGCAGRSANPVPATRAGDRELSCDAIELELAMISQSIARLIPESDKTGKNAALGIAGAFIIVPWFFMDLSNAEKIEIQAYRDRVQTLQVLMIRKGCDSQTT